MSVGTQVLIETKRGNGELCFALCAVTYAGPVASKDTANVEILVFGESASETSVEGGRGHVSLSRAAPQNVYSRGLGGFFPLRKHYSIVSQIVYWKNTRCSRCSRVYWTRRLARGASGALRDGTRGAMVLNSVLRLVETSLEVFECTMESVLERAYVDLSRVTCALSIVRIRYT